MSLTGPHPLGMGDWQPCLALKVEKEPHNGLSDIAKCFNFDHALGSSHVFQKRGKTQSHDYVIALWGEGCRLKASKIVICYFLSNLYPINYCKNIHK